MNKYLHFNGSGYITTTDAAAIQVGVGDFSVCFWMRWSWNDGYILHKFNAVGWYLYGYSTGEIAFFIKDADSALGAYNLPGSGDVPPNNWHFCCFTVDMDGNCTSYLDNLTPRAFSVSVQSLDINSGTDLLIGYDGSTSYYTGDLDDIRIYKSVLSKTEVAEIYNYAVGRKYSALRTTKTGDFALDCDGDLTDSAGGLSSSITGGVLYYGGGVPFCGYRQRYLSGYRKLRPRYAS